MGLVFLPLSGGELRTWAGAGRLPGPRQGFAVTPSMLESFEAADQEDAEYTALSIASLAGLLVHGQRVVAVVDLAATDAGDEWGSVTVGEVPFTAVTAIFGEDSDPAQASAAALAVAGLDLASAWEQPVVQALLRETDLLWYGPAEWAQAAQG